ncbi:alpha/beta hydrolase [Planktothrix sp. FACHB-1365]|uniref:alpha/beta hydrolase n=1 Tax=Planktothrix sp. FACHB-1365 TaxID=2692855 RepID=UPI001689B11E|nr:alpha/beta hydrolase [Planktothrix sp. FACHB-1365]MBD2483106.1 alpha/beta hydrolase [Planktothrix sp. FACHB-1365]
MSLTSGRWFQKVRNPYQFFTQGLSKYISLALAMILGLTISLGIFAQPAPAIDELRLMYGPANISLSIVDLQTFAQTGDQSNQLRSLVTLAKLTPDQVQQFRQALNYSVQIPTNVVNDLLDSTYGRLVVGAFNQFVASGSTVDVAVDKVIAALRNVTRDGQLSMLELLLSYQGVNAITINVQDLINLYNDVSNLGEQAIAFLKAQPAVQQRLCQ